MSTNEKLSSVWPERIIGIKEWVACLAKDGYSEQHGKGLGQCSVLMGMVFQQPSLLVNSILQALNEVFNWNV